MSYIYSLRYALQPGRDNTERIQDLLKFCKSAGIDEINFFVNHEEINQGHLTLEENQVWLYLCIDLKEILKKNGINFSINPGNTLMHGDRGRVLSPELHFSTMVGANGAKAKAAACPFDPNFHEYLSDIYAQLAKSEPELLWIEDDIRHHKHPPIDWGCFCDVHMAEYSRRIGKTVTREEMVAAILQEGEPHPYRKVYLDCCAEEIENLLALIHKKVKEVSPSTKLALMTSQLPQHCAEGRDWGKTFDALSGDDPRIARPHLPAYNEVTPKVYSNEFNSYVRTAAVVIGEGAQLYPELENYMYSRYAKSNRFTKMQLKSAMAINPIGSTMNLFDMMGTGINFDDHIDTLLRDLKPYLSKLKDLDLKISNQKGIVCLFSEHSSYTIHTDFASRDAILPHDTMWLELLGAFGIACVPSTKYDNLKNEVVAISGQYLRNLNNDEIKTLFANNYMILDGESCAILKERELLHLIYVRDGKWSPVRAGYQTYEQVDDGDIVGGVKEARISLMSQAGDSFLMNYETDVRIITNAYNEYQKLLAPFMTQSDRALILPIKYHETHRWNAQYIGFKDDLIKHALQRVPEEFNPTIWVNEIPFTNLIHYVQDGEEYVYLLNFSNDSYDEFDIVGTNLKSITEITVGEVDELTLVGQSVKTPIPYLDAKLFKLEK